MTVLIGLLLFILFRIFAVAYLSRSSTGSPGSASATDPPQRLDFVDGKASTAAFDITMGECSLKKDPYPSDTSSGTLRRSLGLPPEQPVVIPEVSGTLTNKHNVPEIYAITVTFIEQKADNQGGLLDTGDTTVQLGSGEKASWKVDAGIQALMRGAGGVDWSHSTCGHVTVKRFG